MTLCAGSRKAALDGTPRWVHGAVAAAVSSQRSGRPINEKTVEDHNLTLFEMGRVQTAHGYIQAVERLQQHARKIVEWWASGFDVLVTPTMAEPPARLGEFTPTPEDPARGFNRSVPFAIFTSPFNITGQPAISLPLAQSAAGLPIGVQLIGRFGDDARLLRTARSLVSTVAGLDPRRAA